MIQYCYRRDSDIVAPYGQSAEYIRQFLINSKSQRELDEIISNKTKGVAWIVSNCQSKSGREQYVTELKKYISVDVYGKCGTLKCNTTHREKFCCELFPILNYF